MRVAVARDGKVYITKATRMGSWAAGTNFEELTFRANRSSTGG